MATNTLPIGYILEDKYEIETILGQGGFGITYLAKSIKLEHQVVIKEFLPQSMALRDQSHYTITPYNQEDTLYTHLLKRFLEEAKLLANLRHPNVLKVVDFLEANSTAYFIMDYEEGETLEDYLQRHPTLSEKDILSIMMPILEGTKYVHAQGVLHRDIAPDNIYLKTNGMPMLIDFGAARNAIAQQSQTLSAIAKDGYSPPEQYTPNTDQNASTDIYALGAVMYRMITGKKPANATQRQMALLRGEMDPIGDIAEDYNSNYSKTLLQAVIKALEVQQELRPQSIEAFQKAITEGISIEVDQSRNSQKQNEERKSSNKGILIGIILLLLAIGGMFGYTQYQKVEAEKIQRQEQDATLAAKKAEEAKEKEAKQLQAKKEAAEKEKQVLAKKEEEANVQAKLTAKIAMEEKEATEKKRKHQEEIKKAEEAKEKARLAKIEADKKAEAERIRKEAEADKKRKEAEKIAAIAKAEKEALVAKIKAEKLQAQLEEIERAAAQAERERIAREAEERAQHQRERERLEEQRRREAEAERARIAAAKQPKTVHSDSSVYHLGDERISSRSWYGLHGRCYTINFEDNGYNQSYYLSLEKFGVESASVYINGYNVGKLPRQYHSNPRKRPNFWSSQESISVPTGHIHSGSNSLEICASLVEKPEHPGDLDDMQIRNIKLRRE